MPISTRISSVPAHNRTDVIVTLSVTWEELGDGQGFSPGVRPLLNMTSDRKPEPFGRPKALLDFTAELRKAGYRFGIGWQHAAQDDRVTLNIRVRPKSGVATAEALDAVRAALRIGFGDNLNEIR